MMIFTFFFYYSVNIGAGRMLNLIDSHEINSGHNKANLKLYRKKPLPSEKKSITNTMNLMINLENVGKT